MTLIDIVNFNSDASCLWTEKWLRMLEGGKSSHIYKLLNNFVVYNRKVNLGFTGATVRDISKFNPESISLINSNPDIFEIICRPFSHDGPLLRSQKGFEINAIKGLKIIRETFENTNDFYLSPELVLASYQIPILLDNGVNGVFIDRQKFDPSVSKYIPDLPYMVKGVRNTKIYCAPIVSNDYLAFYLEAIHGKVNPKSWSTYLLDNKEIKFFWRDGESSLLLPFGVDFEERVLSSEKDAGISRLHLSEVDKKVVSEVGKNMFTSFPYRSLKPWFKDMKLHWLASKISDIENSIGNKSDFFITLWLLCISSDVMSSAEKSSPVISVGSEVFDISPDDMQWIGVDSVNANELILIRSERAAEIEDYLAYLELLINGKTRPKTLIEEWNKLNSPHLVKALARIEKEWLNDS